MNTIVDRFMPLIRVFAQSAASFADAVQDGIVAVLENASGPKPDKNGQISPLEPWMARKIQFAIRGDDRLDAVNGIQSLSDLAGEDEDDERAWERNATVLNNFADLRGAWDETARCDDGPGRDEPLPPEHEAYLKRLDADRKAARQDVQGWAVSDDDDLGEDGFDSRDRTGREDGVYDFAEPPFVQGGKYFVEFTPKTRVVWTKNGGIEQTVETAGRKHKTIVYAQDAVLPATNARPVGKFRWPADQAVMVEDVAVTTAVVTPGASRYSGLRHEFVKATNDAGEPMEPMWDFGVALSPDQPIPVTDAEWAYALEQTEIAQDNTWADFGLDMALDDLEPHKRPTSTAADLQEFLAGISDQGEQYWEKAEFIKAKVVAIVHGYGPDAANALAYRAAFGKHRKPSLKVLGILKSGSLKTSKGVMPIRWQDWDILDLGGRDAAFAAKLRELFPPKSDAHRLAALVEQIRCQK